MMPIIWLVSLAKYVLPLLIFKYPFYASWANFILDSIDGDILMHFGMPWVIYTQVDKIADYLTYVVMLLVGRKWKVRKTIIALFVFRTIGQFSFFASGDDRFLFFFPNLLEPLFLVYTFLMFRYGKKAYSKYKKYFWIIWILIIIFKMWNEYNVHIGHVDLSQKYLGISN
ncbi:hypothetical protein ACFL2C_00420 [Patescibacteria group bacterium]